MDWSDLLAEIQVYFSVLSFLEPEQQWSWQHPALAEWMAANHISAVVAMDEAQMWTVLQSLRKAHSKAHAAYIVRTTADRLPATATTQR